MLRRRGDGLREVVTDAGEEHFRLVCLAGDMEEEVIGGNYGYIRFQSARFS
jgi:hypothetical protein